MSAPLFSSTVATTCPVMINMEANSYGFAATAACGQPTAQTVISTLGDATVLNVCNRHAVELIESGNAVPTAA